MILQISNSDSVHFWLRTEIRIHRTEFQSTGDNLASSASWLLAGAYPSLKFYHIWVKGENCLCLFSVSMHVYFTTYIIAWAFTLVENQDLSVNNSASAREWNPQLC